MGAEDIERQGPNVLRMRALGAEVRAVTSGSATLKDAINEAMRDWVTNVETTHYVLGSAMGPHPYPTIVRDLQRRIGDEAAAQLVEVGGPPAGPRARLRRRRLERDRAAGAVHRRADASASRSPRRPATASRPGRHAAAIVGGTPGILHGARSMMLQDRDGQVIEAHSASAGLDYPGIGPQIAALAAAGRLEISAATDREAFEAMRWLDPDRGDPAGARDRPRARGAAADPGRDRRPAGRTRPRRVLVLIGFSGRGDKDLAAFGRFADVEPVVAP